MPVEGASKARGGEARRDLRFELRIGASLRIATGLVPVDVLDVSRGGALVATHLPLAVGANVTLLLERIEIEARIVRVCGGKAGLAFERPIRATDLFFQLGRRRTAAEAEAPSVPGAGPAIAA